MHLARLFISRQYVGQKLFFRSPQFIMLRNTRFVSSYLTGEPPRGVVDDDDPEKEDLIFAYLPDAIRQEMYATYKTDPSTWTYAALANKYNTTKNRAKGVIVMMEMREQKMRELGMLNPDPVEVEIYTKHTANSTESTVEVLMEEYKKSKEEVEDILRRHEEHSLRMANLNDYNAMLAEELEEMREEMGLDTRFQDMQETRMDSSTFVQNYAPELLGDDDFETAKDKYIKKLLSLTKAERTTTFTSYEKRVLSRCNPLPEEENRADVKVDTLSRWKYSFRDLTKQSKDEIPNPTMIRTRTGKWRVANPLEEMNRSWSKKPKYVDLYLARDKMKKYEDPDEDEVLAAKMVVAKRNERKKQLADAGVTTEYD